MKTRRTAWVFYVSMRPANLDSFKNTTYEVCSIKGSETEWSQFVVIFILT